VETFTPLNVKRILLAVLFIAPTFTWITAGPISVSGISTDNGKAALVLGVIGLVLTTAPATVWARVTDLVCAVIAIYCVGHDFIRVERASSGFGGLFGLSPGVGLFLAMVASLGWLGWIGRRSAQVGVFRPGIGMHDRISYFARPY
jgi:hypothetical protein